MARISGGDVKSGIVGGFTEGALGRHISEVTKKSRGAGVALAGFVSGTVSELTGGKFAVGASTGAMGYLFNQMSEKNASQAQRQEGRWARAGEVIGEGSESTFRLGGKIKIEGADDRSALHFNNAVYELTFTEVDADGNYVAGVYPIYQGTLSSGPANAFATDRVIELNAPPGQKFDWKLKLHRVPKNCDNCGAPMINIYEWRRE